MRRTIHPNQATTQTDSHGDWLPAYVVAALHSRGQSLRQLATVHGLHPSTTKHALRSPYPKVEGLIAAALGVAPEQIWPSRYGADGQPNRRRGRRPRTLPPTPPPATARSRAGAES